MGRGGGGGRYGFRTKRYGYDWINFKKYKKQSLIVNVGYQHPPKHGVLLLIVTLDGEDVIDCQPVLGYLH